MDRNRTVAGLDVHKDSIYLCIMGHDEAIIYEKTYGVLTPDLRQMCQDMVERGVTEAAMESTAVYWVPVWNELCESMELKLVNPYFIKQLPGRNSDVKDAQWIAECLLKNLIRGSFVPEPVVQDMRKLNRRIFDLQEDITYYTNKLDAALHRCGLKPRNDVSNRRYKSRKITNGNKYLRKILIEISWTASRTRNCFFSNFSYIQVTQKHKSKMKIQVAIARKILVAVWHMLSKEEDFIDIYLKRLEQQRLMEQKIKSLESKMT